MLQLSGKESPPRKRFNDQTLAMVLIVFGCCSFTVGHIYCNENKFHPVETSMVRGFSVVVICYFFLRYLKLDMTFKSTHNLKWLIARNSIMVVHNFAYIISQYYLPLPIAITLSSTSPLFVFIYDYYLFGVTINRKQVVFLMVSIMGVIITSNSSYLITFIDADFDFEQSNFDGYQTSDPVVRTYAGIAVVLVMMMHGYGLLLTKKLVDVHTAHINFIQGLAILFASSIIFPIAQGSQDYTRMDLAHFFKALIFAGIPISVGQLSYIGALVLTKNMGVITTLSFTTILMGFLISILRYGEKVNLIGVVGSIAIVVGIVFIVKQRDANKR